jgi:hypothetical protein
VSAMEPTPDPIDADDRDAYPIETDEDYAR